MEITKPFDRIFTVLDIETTGGREPDVVQISAVKYDNLGKEYSEFDRYLVPTKPMVEWVRNLTGLSTEFLRRNGAPQEEVIPAFRRFVGDDVVMGYNIKGCDIPHLNRAFLKYGVKPLDNDYVDVYRWAQHLVRGVENYRLETMVRYFDIRQDTFHDALADCYSTKAVFDSMITLCPMEGYQILKKNKPLKTGESKCPEIPRNRLGIYVEMNGSVAQVTMNRFEPYLKACISKYPSISMKYYQKGDKKQMRLVVKEHLEDFLDEFPGSTVVRKDGNQWKVVRGSL